MKDFWFMKKFFKHYSFILLTLFFLGSCHDNSSDKVERQGEPTIYIVQDSNQEMNDAIDSARKSIDKFKIALLSGNSDFSDFNLKVHFNYPGGDEHIWLVNVTYKNNEYYGIVNNVPEFTKEVKLGDIIKINEDNISDWMYFDKRKLRGGYTIKALRSKMSQSERQKLDSMIGN